MNAYFVFFLLLFILFISIIFRSYTFRPHSYRYSKLPYSAIFLGAHLQERVSVFVGEGQVVVFLHFDDRHFQVSRRHRGFQVALFADWRRRFREPLPESGA